MLRLHEYCYCQQIKYSLVTWQNWTENNNENICLHTHGELYMCQQQPLPGSSAAGGLSSSAGGVASVSSAATVGAK